MNASCHRHEGFTSRTSHHEHDTTAIVTAIIDMAHDLGLVVIAEGVENATHAEVLTSLGCDRAQGHLYSRPVAADDLAQLLAANH
jgi:EAL domain-containing protein (putative c-di-GMP-specific phosphodiesterase class I)